MPAKKKRKRPQPRSTKAAAQPPAKLTQREEDLLRHMAHGYQLETSSLWDNPVLRRVKDNTEVRADANRSTIEALEKAGLIAVAKKGGVMNPTVWRVTTKASTLKLTEPHRS